MIPDQVKQILDQNGLEALEFSPGSTPTARQAAEQIGATVGQIAKSILMRGRDGSYRMFVTAGDRRINSGKVKRLTGIKHSMADAHETLEVTGYPPGGVCPFAVTGIEIYLDASLKEYETIYPAAGTDSSGVPVGYHKLMEITGALQCDVSS